ncbi:hypothetical protein ACLGIH_20450 [Streptomyces sp. HMX87]|uniref:hypothetical protein n=1 Tax=Streptomyces sp. HMX87 TaxID=3390849 RepID=UPI003A859DCA
MADIKAEKIGLASGDYQLPCGCNIRVVFPGGYLHLHHTGSQCPELARLWKEVQSLQNSYGAPDPWNWRSMDKYIECLRHVGAWEGRIKSTEQERDKYPHPDAEADYPITKETTGVDTRA